VNKTVAAAQLANCILFHAYSRSIMQLPAARAQTKTSYSLFNVLAYQYFDGKLRTIEAENP